MQINDYELTLKFATNKEVVGEDKMSINVNLKGNEVEKIKGFKINERVDKGQKWKEYYLPGISLFLDKGRYHTILHQLTESVPEVLKDIVEEISFYDHFSSTPKRITGIYQHKSAEAEVDLLTDKNFLSIRIIGKNMKDVLELYREIRAGKAVPLERWDQEHQQRVEEKSLITKPSSKKIVSIKKETDESKYNFL